MRQHVAPGRSCSHTCRIEMNGGENREPPPSPPAICGRGGGGVGGESALSPPAICGRAPTKPPAEGSLSERHDLSRKAP